MQHRVVLRRLEEAEGAAEKWIDERAGVHDVKIQRDELAAEREVVLGEYDP